MAWGMTRLVFPSDLEVISVHDSEEIVELVFYCEPPGLGDLALFAVPRRP